MTGEFQLFTSLRFDPALLQIPSGGPDYAGWNRHHASPLYMLDFHRDRILRAATHWKWEAVVKLLSGDAGLKNLEDFIVREVGADQVSPRRVKVVISREGAMSTEISIVPAVPLLNLFPERLPAPETIEEGVRVSNFPSRTANSPWWWMTYGRPSLSLPTSKPPTGPRTTRQERGR